MYNVKVYLVKKMRELWVPKISIKLFNFMYHKVEQVRPWVIDLRKKSSPIAHYLMLETLKLEKNV